MKRAIWGVTGVVCIGQMLFAIANVGQGMLLTSFIDAFGLQSSAQGLPNAAANAGVLLAMLLSVSMAARVGKTTLHTLGIGLMALTLALAGAAQGAVWLALSYLLMGFGFGFIDTTSSAIIADLHQGRYAATLMGVLHAVYGVGGILAPILLTAGLAAGATWRTALWVLSGLALLLCLGEGMLFLRARDRLPASAAPPVRLSLADVRAFARQRGNPLLLLCAVTYCAHQCSIYLWVNRIIGVGYGNPSLGAAALSLFWLGAVLSRLLVPALRLPTIAYLRYGMLASAALLMLGAVVGGPVAVCAATTLAGLLGGATLPMILSEINARNPSRSMLSITAVLLMTSVAAILCAPLIGFIVGKTALIAGIVVAAVAALACGLLAFGLRASA